MTLLRLTAAAPRPCGLALLALLLAGCGQTGPLTLPERATPAAEAAAGASDEADSETRDEPEEDDEEAQRRGQ